MEIIIGAVVIFFIVRFFYVMGRAKSTSEKSSSDGREIYSLCKAKGMDVSDIHSIEYDPRAMALVKERLSKITAAGRIQRTSLLSSKAYQKAYRKRKN